MERKNTPSKLVEFRTVARGIAAMMLSVFAVATVTVAALLASRLS